MISEIVRESLKQSIGLHILFFTIQGWRYEGILKAVDANFLIYFDIKKQATRIQALEDIREVMLK